MTLTNRSIIYRSCAYKALLCMLFFTKLLYGAAASSAFQLIDCFDGTRLTVPNLPKEYCTFLVEQWFASSTAQFQRAELKLFIGVGIFSGPNVAILHTAAHIACDLVRSCTEQEAITRICERDYFLQQLYTKLIQHDIPDIYARQVQLNYSTYIHSRDVIRQPTSLIVPAGMESALTPKDYMVDDATLQQDARDFVALAKRSSLQAEHAHEAIMLIPRLATFTAYVNQRFATRLTS